MLTIVHTAAVLAVLVPLGLGSGVALEPSEIPTTLAQPESADLPTAAELFDAHIEATGGLAAYQRQTDRKIEGIYRLLSQNETQIIRVYTAAPNNFRAELEAPALGTTVRCTNGEIAWGRNLSSKAFLLDDRERAVLLDNAFFLGEAGYNERYTSLTTEGLVQVDGRDAYRVSFTTRTGVKGAVYFDVESKLLVARELASEADPSQNAIVIVSDYQEFDGVKIPMMQWQRLTSQTEPAVEIEFRWVKTNTGDMPSFDPPADLTADSASDG